MNIIGNLNTNVNGALSLCVGMLSSSAGSTQAERQVGDHGVDVETLCGVTLTDLSFTGSSFIPCNPLEF